MNVIEAVKNILSDCEVLDAFNGLHINYTKNSDGDTGLFPNGDQLLKEDVLGNQFRQHNFILYRNSLDLNDADRITQSSFLLDLGYWLETIKHMPITAQVGGKEIRGEIESMSSANGMLFSYPSGNPKDGVMYQLQIYAKYKLEMEE